MFDGMGGLMGEGWGGFTRNRGGGGEWVSQWWVGGCPVVDWCGRVAVGCLKHA